MKSLDDYEVISVIGSGAFGTCFKVQDKITNKIYAWKAINYDEFEESKKEALDSEIGFLQQLKHSNIVQYYDHICNIETKTIFIIMEYCDGGDLQNLIQKCSKEKLKFEEKYIWKVLYQTLKALQLCHNKISEGCILHRDIKPANIFLDKCGNVKLGDFGLARILKRNQETNFAQSFVGSPYYMSPEIVRGHKYDKKSDIWAVGCLIYEMCCLNPPFRGNRFEQLSENISNGRFNSIPNYYSKDLQEIISFILEVDSEQRPNVEILLRHPVFIRNLNDLKADFPKLLSRNDNDNKLTTFTEDLNNKIGVKKLIFSPVSSLSDLTNLTFTDLKNVDDFNGSNGRITGVDTPQLRAELFGSSNNISRSGSFPELNLTAFKNERIYANSIMTSRERSRCDNPQLLTRDIFEEALKTRLETIRAQEMLINHKEINLMEKEKQLMDRENRLTTLEKALEEKKHHIEGMLKRVAIEKRSITKRHPKRRISKTLDESYCTIELNDSSIVPTVAKLEMSVMPPLSGFLRGQLKKSVTFSSPTKIFKSNNETIQPPQFLQPPPFKTLKHITHSLKETNGNDNKNFRINNFESSLSSKTSNEFENSSNKGSGKRRSILSIFGLNNISHKSKTNNNNANNSCKNNKEFNEKPSSILSSKNCEKSNLANSVEILNKAHSDEISKIWTKENKKAAFDMLAAMKSTDKKTYLQGNNCVSFHSQRNTQLRRTTQERGSSLNRSSKLRRSAVYLSPNISGNRVIL